MSNAWKLRNPEKNSAQQRYYYRTFLGTREGMARRMVYKARERGRETLAVTDVDILAAWPSDDCCPVFGWPFFYGLRGGVPHMRAPSLDRVNPNEGYTPTNIAIVSWRANALKRDGVAAEFAQLARWLAFRELL